MNNFHIELSEILDEYADQVKEEAEKAAKKVADETRDELKQTSPENRPRYKNGWSVKTKQSKYGSTSCVVHNRTDYQLTHLLEKGHALHNAPGKRVPAQEHIGPAEKKAQKEFYAECQKAIKNIS